MAYFGDFVRARLESHRIIQYLDSMDREYYNGRRRARRLEFINLLGGACAVCGSKDNLHFDHINPKKKEFRISKNWDAPKAVMLKELKKCQLLCNKCHRDKSFKNQEFGRESKHGTLWRYKNYNCRCDKCRKAVSDYNRRRRIELLNTINDKI